MKGGVMSWREKRVKELVDVGEGWWHKIYVFNLECMRREGMTSEKDIPRETLAAVSRGGCASLSLISMCHFPLSLPIKGGGGLSMEKTDYFWKQCSRHYQHHPCMPIHYNLYHRKFLQGEHGPIFPKRASIEAVFWLVGHAC